MWASAPRAKKGDDDDLEGLAVRTPSFTEADFNDPDLLAELQELAGLNSPAPKPLAAVTKPTASAKVPPTKARPSPIPHDDENIEAVLLSVANLSIDVQHTEFTDHDMSDPELLVRPVCALYYLILNITVL